MGHVFITILVRFLEGIYGIGSIGSVIVLVHSVIEDIKTLFGGEEEHHP